MQFSGTLGLEYLLSHFFGQLSVFSQLALDALIGRYSVGMIASWTWVLSGRLASLIGRGLVMRSSPEDLSWDWSSRTILAILPLLGRQCSLLSFSYTGLESRDWLFVSLGHGRR